MVQKTGAFHDNTGDGQVDVANFTVWSDHFGQMTSGPGGGLTPVPEPSTWVLLLIGAIGLVFPTVRRARRTRNRE